MYNLTVSYLILGFSCDCLSVQEWAQALHLVLVGKALQLSDFVTVEVALLDELLDKALLCVVGIDHFLDKLVEALVRSRASAARWSKCTICLLPCRFVKEGAHVWHLSWWLGSDTLGLHLLAYDVDLRCRPLEVELLSQTLIFHGRTLRVIYDVGCFFLLALRDGHQDYRLVVRNL